MKITFNRQSKDINFSRIHKNQDNVKKVSYKIPKIVMDIRQENQGIAINKSIKKMIENPIPIYNHPLYIKQNVLSVSSKVKDAQKYNPIEKNKPIVFNKIVDNKEIDKLYDKLINAKKAKLKVNKKVKKPKGRARVRRAKVAVQKI
jgi:hypothetical protein